MGCLSCFSNFANKLNGTCTFLLCTMYMTWIWYKFDQNPNNVIDAYDPPVCNKDELWNNFNIDQDQLCGGLAGVGAVATIACLTALFGGCSKNTERNVATVSAAFGLLNLANAVENLNYYDLSSCQDDSSGVKSTCGAMMGAGIFHALGAICGLAFALMTCKKGEQKNNLAFLLSIFFFALGLACIDWQKVDQGGCNVKQSSDAQQKLEDGDACTIDVFKGLFDLAVMLLILFCAFLLICKKSSLQGGCSGGMQFALVSLSIGFLMFNYFVNFWYMFGKERQHMGDDGVMETVQCSKKADVPNGQYCLAMAIGGIEGLIGVPLAVLAAIFFCCGFTGDKDNEDIYASQTNYDTTGQQGLTV